MLSLHTCTGMYTIPVLRFTTLIIYKITHVHTPHPLPSPPLPPHRVVPVSEASVMIAASSEHRKEAIEAVAHAIDAVKSTATIWKKVPNQRLGIDISWVNSCFFQRFSNLVHTQYYIYKVWCTCVPTLCVCMCVCVHMLCQKDLNQ